ncbi:Hypothetical predicted protein [Mytilus galloprovincialis]|uniref:Reverse transcriptase zinc-binding domain-containing protein n=1 Tax=Mytilus galloprovincialis TaxID=29158 RepID=A0A8B6E8I3_MYTGA|nr:Hypothetical predicted protein [Mytilus galloprovincialis]
MGQYIGTNFTGCPTCADDIILLSSTEEEMQSMLDTSKRYSDKHRYKIHPTKSVTINKYSNSKTTKSEVQFKLDDKNMPSANQGTHLGIIRAIKDQNKTNIQDRISLARRTAYSLMNVGVHEYTFYQGLLYSLEVLLLNNGDIKLLRDFHVNFLRQIQALPSRTAISAVYLLVGALPIEAEIHKRVLSLFHSIFSSNNENLKKALERQYVLQTHELTFLNRVADILYMYNLPPWTDLKDQLPSKLSWKCKAREAINNYWKVNLQRDANSKTTLKFLCIPNLDIGKPHTIWNSLPPNIGELRKATIKARLCTGTYIFQSQKARFSNMNLDATCPICQLEEEDIIHFLTRCPVLEGIRRESLSVIKRITINKIGLGNWNSNFHERTCIASTNLGLYATGSKQYSPQDDLFP